VDAIQRIHLADDGSQQAAWMLHYALRMASRAQPARLQVLHVRERGDEHLQARMRQHALLAERYGVEVIPREIDRKRDVPGTLAEHVETGPRDVVIVGFRAHTRGRGLAFGSVGQALLSRHDHSVLAMRIVQPGNLGLPKVLAMGLSESPRLHERLLPALQLFAPDLDELWLLRVMEVQLRFLGLLTFEQAQALQQKGQSTLGAAALALRDSLDGDAPYVDSRVSVADRWPTQLVIDAHRVHAHLLLLGASDHLLPRRFALSNPLETVLRNAACDVAVFRAAST
jgi:nucleotide-binding universal stress UspA family protein